VKTDPTTLPADAATLKAMAESPTIRPSIRVAARAALRAARNLDRHAREAAAREVLGCHRHRRADQAHLDGRERPMAALFCRDTLI
jgi:hypothetical protein